MIVRFLSMCKKRGVFPQKTRVIRKLLAEITDAIGKRPSNFAGCQSNGCRKRDLGWSDDHQFGELQPRRHLRQGGLSQDFSIFLPRGFRHCGGT